MEILILLNICYRVFDLYSHNMYNQKVIGMQYLLRFKIIYTALCSIIWILSHQPYAYHCMPCKAKYVYNITFCYSILWFNSYIVILLLYYVPTIWHLYCHNSMSLTACNLYFLFYLLQHYLLIVPTCTHNMKLLYNTYFALKSYMIHLYSLCLYILHYALVQLYMLLYALYVNYISFYLAMLNAFHKHTLNYTATSISCFGCHYV